MNAKPAVEIHVSDVRSAIDVDGRPVVVVRYRGRPAIPAQTVGEILGYAEHGKTLAKVIRKDWSEEFQPGVHLDVLRGEDLAEFKRHAAEAVSPATRALMVLYPKGVALLASKSGKPAGRRLADSMGEPAAMPAVVEVAAVQATRRPADKPPWWWVDVHRYLDRCVAAGVLTEPQALARLAPLYESVLGLPV